MMIIAPPAVMYGPPTTFREFIEAPLFKGLGENVEDLRRLLADDKLAAMQFAGLTTAPRGGANNPKGSNQHQKVVNADNVSIDQDLFPPPKPPKKKAVAGNSCDYTLVRLKNERPDLFERVVAKELTANRAAIEAGWRKKRDGA
jgi:hypothetical protein